MAKHMFSSRKVGEQPFNFWGGVYIFFLNRTWPAFYISGLFVYTV